MHATNLVQLKLLILYLWEEYHLLNFLHGKCDWSCHSINTRFVGVPCGQKTTASSSSRKASKFCIYLRKTNHEIPSQIEQIKLGHIPGATPTESHWVRPNPTKSDWIRLNPTKSDQIRPIQPNPTKSDRVRPNWHQKSRSDQIRPNTTESSRIRPNPSESDQIRPNQT